VTKAKGAITTPGLDGLTIRLETVAAHTAFVLSLSKDGHAYATPRFDKLTTGVETVAL